MKISLFFMAFCGFGFSVLASEQDIPQGYDCENLNGHLDHQIASTPEWKIRTSLNNWEKNKGDMPALEAPLVSFVYHLCEEDRNSARQVQDIVFDILDQAEFESWSASNTHY
ncbi:hypothetical protein AB4298_00825 [Shewanella sp. 10N.261.52.F9]|uniref:hypothetical protein n=1 Tax=Shewanella sp. 10N.261.52.F9 TaxID=3229684 RepID=UPI00354FCE28